ncbi:MAG: response regulator transcription factor [Clostridia bacterium]|nr:response regulator transcription factor [Clostridia bacterium]
MLNEQSMKIAVCDDAAADLEKIIGMTEKYFSDAGIPYRISGFDSAEALSWNISTGEQYQLLLLDIMMDKMDGMELARRLRKMEDPADIVFISSNREMALAGYEVDAVRYLAKPLEAEKFTEAMDYCCKRWAGRKEILLPTDQGGCRISAMDIRYAEAFDRGTRFVLGNETVESRLKFSEVRRMLPEKSFLTCHRAYIVSLSFVKYIRPYEFVLKNGECIAIAKGRYPDIRKKFMDYIAD